MQTLSEDLLEGAAAAAEFIGISRKRVYRLTEKDELPVIRKGGRLYYRKSDLQRAFQVAA